MSAFLLSLYDQMCCPVTGGPLRFLASERLPSGEIYNGLVVSERLGRVVGRIKAFQLDFVRHDPEADAGALERDIAAGQAPRVVSERPLMETTGPFDPEILYIGPWRPIEERMMVTDGDDGSAAITFRTRGRCEILFEAHPWSGGAVIAVGGRPVAELDLYNPHVGVPRSITIDAGEPSRGQDSVAVVVRPTGRCRPEAMGRQVLFAGYRQHRGRYEPLVHEKKPLNRGAAFPDEFYQALAEAPADGRVLDLGGGVRQLDDPRYVNLDYAPFAEPDVIGDGHCLPFKDDTFDVVYSSGVFEHLYDPLRAGREVARVLKPGGLAIHEIAFMQPIHTEGQHFFNVTPWGAERIFADLEIEKVWWGGSFSWQMQWFADVSAAAVIAPDATRRFVEAAREMEAVIPPDRLKYIASAVFIRARKRR